MVFWRSNRSEKIIVIAQGILGDMLTMTPVLREIRRMYAAAHITAIVDPIGEQVLLGSSDVNSIYVTNRCRDSKIVYIFGKIKFSIFLLTHRASLYIDLYGGHSSKFFSRFCMAEQKIMISGSGIQTKGFICDPKELNFPNEHHLSVPYQRILKFFCVNGIDLSVRPSINLCDDLLTGIEKQYLRSLKIGKNNFLISIGAGDIKKIPNIDQMARVIGLFSSESNLNPVVITNPGQESLSQQLFDLITDKCKPKLLQPISIRGVISLMKAVRFAVVPDSGLLHLAVACQTPFVGIFVLTPPREVEPDSGLYEMVYKPSPEKIPYRDKGLYFADPKLDDQEIIRALEKLFTRIKKDEALV